MVNYAKHCRRCKPDRPCKRRHVYAMELDSAIAEEPWFLEMNPDYQEGKPCLYVGKTIHHPLCRKSMHMNCRGEDWNEQVWTCVCHRKPGVNACGFGNKTSRSRVSRHMTGFLRPRLYKYINPQRGPAPNDEAEYQLAMDLRAKGMGVYTDAKGVEE